MSNLHQKSSTSVFEPKIVCGNTDWNMFCRMETVLTIKGVSAIFQYMFRCSEMQKFPDYIEETVIMLSPADSENRKVRPRGLRRLASARSASLFSIRGQNIFI